MLALWKEFLRNNAAAWNLEPNADWKVMLHNNYHPHCNSMNLLWFCGQPFPSVVTKLYQEPTIIEREFENLRQVYSAVTNVSPRPLHFGFVAGFWTLWMSGVPGHRFQIRQKYPPQVLQSITDTIISMHLSVRKPSSSADQSRYDRMVIEPLDTLARFGNSSAVRDGCGVLAASTSIDWVSSLPVIPQHGDLYVGNLLSHAHTWRIVDWESFGAVDVPLHDLLTLLLSLLQSVSPDARGWPDWLVKQAPALIQRYCEAIGLSPGDSRMLLPLALANWFRLQWADGRQEFSERLYQTIDQYFRGPGIWQAALTSASRDA